MSGMYKQAREDVLAGDLDLEAADIRAVFIDAADYTVDLETHDFLNDVPAAARVGTPVALTGETVAGGVFDANDVVFPALTGDVVEAILLFVHTGVDATAQLIAYIDTGTGLPLTPNGTDVTITWSNAAQRIFRLVNA